MRFEFTSANRIIFGSGTLREAGPLARELGTRALLVFGAHQNRTGKLPAILAEAKISVVPFSIPGEPTVDQIVQGVQTARREKCDLVIGMGGGSAMDAAKAISAMMTNEGELADYLEVIGKGKALTKPAAPCIAIPTTAGTGAEVTRNAVLTVPSHKVKVSLRSPFMLPRIALVDPELTLYLPPALTASTGMDALTQLIEPFVSTRANPMTDALCREGMRRVARSLLPAFSTRNNLPAREDMALASLYGGLALANAGLGAVHGLAGPIGGLIGASHGAVCAALLPAVMNTNIEVLREKKKAAIERYDEVAVILTGRANASAKDGVEWVSALVKELGIRCLGAQGMTMDHLPALASNAVQASSMKSNPVPLSPSELSGLLHKTLWHIL